MSRIAQRRTVNGYLDMGRPQIPPLPPYTVFTDRADGETQWLLTFEGTAPDYVVVLDDDLPRTPDVEFYDPFDGPYLRRGTVRLFVSDGVLQAEAVAEQADGHITNRRIFARVGRTKVWLEITVPDDWEDGDPIVITPVPPGTPFPYPSIGHMSIPFVIM